MSAGPDPAAPSAELIRLRLMFRSRDRRAPPPLAKVRRDLEELTRLFPPPPEVAVRSAAIAAPAADWLEPPDARPGVILYLHGGGYVSGSRSTHRDLAARLARAACRRLLLVDYRLAPEHPFPAAGEDALAAHRWLAAATPGEPLVVIGDSAGGGLALSLLQALRDGGGALPRAAVLISPWTDLSASGRSIDERADLDPVFCRADVERMAALYLAGAEARDPRASPLFGSFVGLPPLLVLVGTSEILFDDAARAAERAVAAGVDASLESWPAMIHVWPFYARLLPEGEAAIARIGEFVERACGRAPQS